tara:strand:+ start:44 stop:409 length:366 start_codon:yes stop_codon:yes gene_type:complete
MYYYKIQDKDTNAHYIGSCVNLEKRIYQHKKGKKVSCKDIIKNNNYDIIILEISDNYTRLEREQYWMNKHPDRINQRPAVRQISKKEYNRVYQKRQSRWLRSFGDPRSSNCVAKTDPFLFQ